VKWSAAFFFAVLVLTPVPAVGAGVEISATRVEGDGNTGVLVARGNVRISDGLTFLVGAQLVADLRARRAVLTGGRVHSRDGLLEASRIELTFTAFRITRILARQNASLQARGAVLFAQMVEVRPQEGRLAASGDVRVFTPPDVVAFGSRLTYDRATGRLLLEGPVRVQTGQGAVRGTSLEALEGLEEITVRGGVRIDYLDVRGRAETARVLARAQKAVLVGDVFVQRDREALWADRVTIFYSTRRVVAEGVRRMVVEEEGEAG
jgi:lipopolysaccharide export system protein LptA